LLSSPKAKVKRSFPVFVSMMRKSKNSQIAEEFAHGHQSSRGQISSSKRNVSSMPTSPVESAGRSVSVPTPDKSGTPTPVGGPPGTSP
jgi:hypothetical protein